MKERVLFSIFLSILFLSILTMAAEQQPIAIHVDARRGNDSNQGSSDAPVKSLPRAIELSRQKPGAKSITLAAGRYQLNAPLLLDRDSDLTIAGDPGAATIISGGRAITGWKRVGDLLQAELPEVRRKMAVSRAVCRK